MVELLFHPLYALNLLDDLANSRLLDFECLPDSMRSRLLEGKRAGWINNTHQRTAREMFIFADRVILPPGFELPVKVSAEIEDAIVYPRGGTAQRFSTDCSPLATVLASLIYDPEAPDRKIRDTIRWLRDLNEFEAAHGLGEYNSETILGRGLSSGTFYELSLRGDLTSGRKSNRYFESLTEPQKAWATRLATSDPYKHRKRFRKYESLVREAMRFASVSEELAVEACPTLAFFRPSRPIVLPDSGGDLVAVTRLYFENVRMPSPDTIQEALDYRSNGRIANWRAKMRSWSDNPIDPAHMKMELDEASGYVEGIRGMKTLLAQLPSGFSLSLSALGTIPLGMPPKMASAMGVISLAIDGVRWCVDGVYRNVTGDSPSKHNWLMVGQPSHRRAR